MLLGSVKNISSLEEMDLEIGSVWPPKEELPLGWEALTELPEGPGHFRCCWREKGHILKKITMFVNILLV